MYGHKMSCVTRKLTPAGEWAQYFMQHPDELPKNAPDPAIDPGGFASWAKHNLPAMVTLNRVEE